MMSKSKSSLARGLRALYLLPLIFLGIGLQARTVYVPKDKDSNNSVSLSPIVLTVNEEGGISIEGKEIQMKDVSEHLQSLGIPSQEIVVKVEMDQDTPAQLMTELRDQFRQAGVSKVQYRAFPTIPIYILRQASGKEKEITEEEFNSLGKESIQSVELLQDPEELEQYGEKANNGVLIINLKQETVRQNAQNPLIILRQAWGEEKEITKAEYDALSQSRINSIQMLKDEAAFKKYGDKAAHGVIVVNLKAPMEMEEIVVVSYRDQDDDDLIPFRLIPDPDHMPRFQGGDLNEFSKWLCRQISVPKDCDHSGTMKVSFEVLEDGTVGDVEVTESVCPELDALVKATIQKSPKWEPGTNRDGKPIATYLRLPIVFQVRPAPKKEVSFLFVPTFRQGRYRLIKR